MPHAAPNLSLLPGYFTAPNIGVLNIHDLPLSPPHTQHGAVKEQGKVLVQEHVPKVKVG